MIEAYRLIDKLEREHALSLLEYQTLIEAENEALRLYASNKAKEVANSIYGNSVYVRGLIEVGNYCRNDCFYCGIRKSNSNCDRYILDEEDNYMDIMDEKYIKILKKLSLINGL